MADRVCLPGEMSLDAIIVDPVRILRQAEGPGDNSWVQPGKFDNETVERIRERGSYIALRWVLNTSVGMPFEPFTVWRRPPGMREPAVPIAGWKRYGDTFWWDGLTEMLRIELDVSGPVTAYGLTRLDLGPVSSVTGGPGTIVLQGGPMLGVRVSNAGAVTAARGLSTVRMAAGDHWQPIERVGLPLAPELSGASYYAGDQQGIEGGFTDPITAAIDRLKNWAPVAGWAPLVGLPPWTAPDPQRLIDEYGKDLVPGLVAIMGANPPPDVAQQATAARPPLPLDELVQAGVIGKVALNGAGDNQRSELTIRPLQALATAVASDTWASLALGFGTGAEIGQRDPDSGATDDFMVTAPWDGLLQVQVPVPWPWPWNAPPPLTVTKECERELVAIVLSPELRMAPAVPAPLAAAPTYAEGAPLPDTAYRSSVKIETPRPVMQPGSPHASAYALARFDSPGAGRYELRQHTTAGGWIPIGSAAPVRDPAQPPDPALTPGTVMLRDSGVPRPITGADLQYQYAVAATDLFGQWSGWNSAWLSLAPAGIQAPSVSVVRATARVGAGGGDPCSMDVSAEVVWDASERTCSRMEVVVDVFDPTPSPPAPIDAPPGSPQAGFGVSDIVVSFDAAGYPSSVPGGVTVTPLHADDSPVTLVDPFEDDERRYRISFSGLAVTYGAAVQKAVSVYVQAEERVRPGEWSDWGSAKEAALAGNPIPPPPQAPLPAEYPAWASLPDAAGLSYASVAWAPTGAWRYRVYEATEAALRAACGQPGPVLSDGFGGRMQALFDLHRNAANWPALKAAYRKLGTEPISPPLENGVMRDEALLPRGSSLIHCFVVVGVTENNVISGWPQPDADGRKGFLAYAIPRALQPSAPEIQASVGETGTPEVTVRMTGALPVTSIRLYRATSAVAARHSGTMQLIATVTPDPASWQETVIADAGAPTGWDRLQYRAIASATDDPDRGGMAIDSPESRAYQLLNPPPDAPSVTLTEETAQASLTMAIVQVATSAPRRRKAVGDHLVGWIYKPPGGAVTRGSAAAASLPGYDTMAAFVTDGAPAGYIGEQLYLRLDRTGGASLALAVDVTDPLARATHALLDVPEFVPEPAPVISNFTVEQSSVLINRAVYVGFDTNVPLPPNALHEWTVTLSMRVANLWFGPVSTRSFAISQLPEISSAAALRQPTDTPAQFVMCRVANSGRILGWFRASAEMQVGVKVENSIGQSATAEGAT